MAVVIAIALALVIAIVNINWHLLEVKVDYIKIRKKIIREHKFMKIVIVEQIYLRYFVD